MTPHWFFIDREVSGRRAILHFPSFSKDGLGGVYQGTTTCRFDSRFALLPVFWYEQDTKKLETGMADRIEIGFGAGIRDALGEKIRRRIVAHLRIKVEKVRTVEVYTIDDGLSSEELQHAACGPLSDPIIQQFAVNSPLVDGFDWLIEVGFRPGVTDNVGKTAREAIGLLLGKRAADVPPVYTSRQYVISGVIGRSEVETIATSLLANELIERYEIIDGSAWDAAR